MEINCRNVYRCLNEGRCEQIVCGNFSILDKKINCPIFLNSKNNKIEYTLEITGVDGILQQLSEVKSKFSKKEK